MKEIGRNFYIILSQIPCIRNRITGTDIFGVNENWKKFTTRFSFLASKFYSISTRIEDDNQQISIEVTVKPTINWELFADFYKSTILNTGNITVVHMKMEYLKDIIRFLCCPTFSGKELDYDENVSFTVKYENEEENLAIGNKIYEELYEFTKIQKKERSTLVKAQRKVYYSLRNEKKKLAKSKNRSTAT